jgi:hypothetical protein
MFIYLSAFVGDNVAQTTESMKLPLTRETFLTHIVIIHWECSHRFDEGTVDIRAIPVNFIGRPSPPEQQGDHNCGDHQDSTNASGRYTDLRRETFGRVLGWLRRQHWNWRR